MLLDSSSPRTLGVGEHPVLRFGREHAPEDSWPGRRLMFLREAPAFELSHFCGTCQVLFKRLDGANETLSQVEVEPQLTAGLSHVDDAVVETFGGLLPAGRYVPMLLSIQPRLILPARPGDYFSEEQIATWGVDPFWGLPEYPQTPYYRTWQAPVDDERHLFEFVVPMVPPSWNDRTRVKEYEQLLAASSTPTAVAVTLLDIAAPAVAAADATDYFEHWGLMHFLLDGHHKVQAAARTGRSVRLLSLLAIDFSNASAEDAQAIPDLRRLPEASRKNR